MTYLQLFGISIPVIWIAVLVTALLLSIRLDDWFSNAIFIYILIWKLSYIFQWESIWGLLYFNGGKIGHWLGLISAVLYIALFAQKKYPSLKAQASITALLFIYIFEVISNLLHIDFLFAAIQGAICCLILLLHKRLNWQWILLFFAMELLTLSLQHTLTLTKLFTFSMLIFITLIIKEKKNG